ncbi:conserved hypothetical protein [Candidatus Desulfarcum epimagneticum]|uniref:Uncharacterized protein n=1 Tax=uncultured Desulfobacteraceae bacterium TaxID=218296 RepID=A0A484HDE6_9BACT|nr:conserved hypothetical protein [uncultured Desulfobacteraceae bacterium]
MNELLLINPNMVFPGDSGISGRSANIRDVEKVINLGLLTIATCLDDAGVSLKIIDLVGIQNDAEMLLKALEREKPRYVGIACISCFAYPKVAEYAKLIKKTDKNIFIMAGGQHISGIPQIAMREMPDVDCVVKGEGEYVARQVILNMKNRLPIDQTPSIIYRSEGEVIDHTHIEGEKVDLNKIPFLRYDLYPDFKKFSPHVEESRWCPFKCHFCTSTPMANGVSSKDMPRFVDELEYVRSLYGQLKEKLKFFLACSTFGLKKKRIEEFIRIMREKELNIEWRTETRVDLPIVDYLEELVEVGLSVIDLGLESGSPRMLRLMNKCPNPEKYLEDAEIFISKVSKIKNLALKVNLVFYAGETPDTVMESTNFLFKHRAHIDSMSAGPVVLYPGVPMEELFPQYEADYGSSFVKGEFWEKVHAKPVNSSIHFSFNQLNEMALTLSKMLCRGKEYFEVKKYGQFPLGLEFKDFQNMVSELEPHKLPFDFSMQKSALSG